VAVASQKVTRPVVTGEPLLTEAVRVTTVPAVTEEADRVSVVVVAVPAACATGAASMVMIAVIALRRIDTERWRRLREYTSGRA
jgi:hypothetical protein